MKSEVKVGMVIDDYKLPNKDKFWNESLKNMPEILAHYELLEETSSPGPGKNITSLFRTYRLKGRAH